MIIGRGIIPQLLKEKAQLEDIINRAELYISGVSEQGRVRVAQHGQGVQFYLVDKPYQYNGTYMPVSDRPKAIKLLQKRYCEEVLRRAYEQRQCIDKFLRAYNPEALRDIYTKAGALRRKFLKPYDLPDAEFLERWLAEEYEGLPFAEDAAEHYTLRGERVRSKSEVLIADALYRSGIPYKYERPLLIGGREFHPDFTLMRMTDREEVYWEHLGMMDDPEYLANALAKIRHYEANGIYPGDRLILTAETSRLPINQLQIQAAIDHYLLK